MENSSLLNIGLGLLAGAPAAFEEGRARQGKREDAAAQREARRAEALQKKQIGEYKLAEMGRQNAMQAGTQDVRLEVAQQQLAQQAQQIRRTENKLRKTEMFDTLRLVFDSGSPQAFNRYLQDNQDNPQVANQFKGTVRLDKLNLQSEEDRRMLIDAGIPEAEFDALDGTKDGNVDWDKLQARFFKSVDNTGRVEIKDMVRTAAAMGYDQYADNTTLTRMERLADISKATKASQPTAMVRESLAVGEARARLEAGAPQLGDKELLERHGEETGGVKVGRQMRADDAITAWDAAGFDNLTQKELQQSKEARQYIRAIELDKPLSNADEKDLKELGTMIDLVKEAGNLSEKQTGFLDAPVAKMFSYINDDTTTKQDKSSYMALVNTFRHNLFGSALTEGELKAFAAAYGTDGQQLGPVLAGLRSMAVQISSKMQTISNLNNDKVVKFRMGQSAEDIQRAQVGIEQRLEFLNLLESGMSPTEAAKAVRATGKGNDYMTRPVTPNSRAVEDKPAADFTADDVASALGL